MAPSASTGRDGDWYLATSSHDAYEKVTGSWVVRVNLRGATGAQGIQGATGATGAQGATGATGSQGLQGLAGTNGISWSTGATVPTTGGVVGDLYLLTTTGDVYQRGASAWSLLTNIRGTQGAQGEPGTAGSRWYTGAGAPAAGLGVLDDLYLNATDGAIFTKGATGWSATGGTLRGPQGATGDVGAAGRSILSGTSDPTTEGAAGDFYLNTATNTLFGPKTTTWPAGVSLVGPQGTPGTGSTWRTGTTAPDTSLGNNGDFYLNTTTGAVSAKSAGTWTSIYTPPAATAGGATLALSATKTSGSQILSSSNATNTGDVVTFDNVVGSNAALGSYNTSTSTFTVAQAGFYFVQAVTRSVDASPVTNTVNQNLFFSINGGDSQSLTAYHGFYTAANNSNYPAGIKGKGYANAAYYLNAGDTVRVLGLSSNSSTAGTTLKTVGSCQFLIIKM